MNTVPIDQEAEQRTDGEPAHQTLPGETASRRVTSRVTEEVLTIDGRRFIIRSVFPPCLHRLTRAPSSEGALLCPDIRTNLHTVWSRIGMRVPWLMHLLAIDPRPAGGGSSTPRARPETPGLLVSGSGVFAWCAIRQSDRVECVMLLDVSPPHTPPHLVGDGLCVSQMERTGPQHGSPQTTRAKLARSRTASQRRGRPGEVARPYPASH